MNKLSLVGIQLPQKYKETFDVSSEGPPSGVTGRAFARNVEILLIFFRYSCIPTNESLFFYFIPLKFARLPENPWQTMVCISPEVNCNFLGTGNLSLGIEFVD